MLKKLIAALFLFTSSVAAQQLPDLVLTQGSQYVQQRGVSWGNNFNRNYIVVPLSPQTGICFYVINNNPTNTQTFSISVFQSSDGNSGIDFQNNQGRYSAVQLSGLSSTGQTVSPLATVAGFVNTTAAAKVAFKFFGSAAAGAGSPDTADIF